MSEQQFSILLKEMKKTNERLDKIGVGLEETNEKMDKGFKEINEKMDKGFKKSEERDEYIMEQLKLISKMRDKQINNIYEEMSINVQ